ncbi:probable serine/threonine-protein kinase pats1 [Saccostrea cucullata]|uniref:probable serine/threonine-protein kinase pats1 n=1 Tax=Saccostrea cuccullata TaxID=36930 RepID=UPI002ED1D542
MYFTDVHLRDIINFTDIQGGIIDKQGSILKFKSDDIRHDVMYAFVTECLVEDSDLEFFLTTASRDVISEYCRSWWYERREGERCLYVPDEPGKMYDLFIDKLQLDIITHCTMSDKRITDRISKRLNIPEEVLGRNFDARQRFVKNSKLGSKEMFRARGMIVGCAGAGKTTLLRKLHGRIETDWNKPSKTTIGLEVHEDLFTIEDNKLIDFGMDKTDSDEKPYLDKKVISMTDFAGQVAYYACHQVYLSRRAFYIVVVDMSKKLKKESRMYDRDRHDPTGSLFHSWTYGDYVHFWLQTINTYCNDGITKKDPKDTREIKDSGVNVNFQPVILVATHKDKLVGLCKTSDTMDAFFSEVEECLSKEQTLKQLISPYRYFEVECPSKVLTRDQQRSIDLVKKCIVETVQQLPQWGEKIPLKWFEIERILNQKKSNGDRVLKRHQLMETAKTFLMDENDLNDVLRYLHEIGKIIYFSEDKLKETIIIDVQWFVDAFKYIITDKKHFARKDSKNIFVNTGKISKKYIEEVWKSIKGIYNSLWQSYVNNKDDIFQYMNKLGLMTKLETKGGVDNDEKMYYIPSMNRTDLPDGRKDEIYRKQKSSMMVYFFKSYLPHFFFFRLVVNCLRKWKVCNEESFFKNAAFYKAEEAGHFFAIAVSKTSIQLQVFTQDESVKEECVKKIRQTVESLIKEITETFHRGIIYDSGFSCKDINITDEDEEYFLKESEIIQEIRNSQEMPPCPRHLFEPNDHKVDANKIHMCLLERGSSMSIRDN